MSLKRTLVAGAILFVVLLGGLAAFELTRIAPARSLALPSTLPKDPVERGRILFAHGDLGVLDLDTLETSALPWTILTAAMALDTADGDPSRVAPTLVEERFRAFGFLYPASTDGTLLPMQPYGLTIGRIERTVPPLRVTAANLGCAACHSGVTYDAEGLPDPTRPVPGAPSTALDLEAYAQEVYRALQAALADEPALWAAIDRLHPDLGMRERLTLRYVVLPMAHTRMAQLQASGDRPLPFNNGFAGHTNGVAALNDRLGVEQETETGFVSIPDLGDRAFRTSFLADGAYAPPGTPRFAPRTAQEAQQADPMVLARIGSFFTVPSMGMTPERAEGAIEAFADIVRYLGTYEAPRFPGPIERQLLPLGRDTYTSACASCHGTYDENLETPRLLTFPNWAGDVGTDMSRAQTFGEDLAQAVAASAYGVHIDPASTGKLVAPLLTGLWASAPYFVNGSVPTLRHLLEPQTRPERFLIGGHALDMERVGIALTENEDGIWRYPEGYEPFSNPSLFDASAPGFSNAGHEREVEDLSPQARDALIQYLKLL